MVRNNPWKAYHSLMLSCLMLLQVVNSKHRTIRNQSGKTEPPNSNGDEPMHSYRWEEETGVEIPASKSTVLRGHESEVFICLRLNPTTFRRVELKFRATKMSPHLTVNSSSSGHATEKKRHLLQISFLVLYYPVYGEIPDEVECCIYEPRLAVLQLSFHYLREEQKMASFICSMPSEDLSLKKVRSEELYVYLKKWLVFPRIGRHGFGSQISASKREKHYLNRLVAFSTSGISLPAISLFFFNSSKIILLGGLNFSVKASFLAFLKIAYSLVVPMVWRMIMMDSIVLIVFLFLEIFLAVFNE
ncbi:hypothetical protein DAPPUDRAFT_337232, partial [Daphnia pulex]